MATFEHIKTQTYKNMRFNMLISLYWCFKERFLIDIHLYVYRISPFTPVKLSLKVSNSYLSTRGKQQEQGRITSSVCCTYSYVVCISKVLHSPQHKCDVYLIHTPFVNRDGPILGRSVVFSQVLHYQNIHQQKGL